MLFILQNLRSFLLLFIAVIFAGLISYIVILTSKNNALVSENLLIKSKLEISNVSIGHLTDAVSAQNSAIETFRSASAEKERLNKIEVNKALAVSEVHKTRAEELLKSMIPQNISRCDAANLIINEEIKNARK